MAQCGIEEYDKLPARVGWIDVDFLRWKLYRCDHPWFKIPGYSHLRTREKIVAKLEEAKEEHRKLYK